MSVASFKPQPHRMGLDSDSLRFLIGRVRIERHMRHIHAILTPGEDVTSTTAEAIVASTRNFEQMRTAIIQYDEETEDNARRLMRTLIDETFIRMEL